MGETENQSVSPNSIDLRFNSSLFSSAVYILFNNSLRSALYNKLTVRLLKSLILHVSLIARITKYSSAEP